MPGIVDEHKRRVLIGNLRMQYFQYRGEANEKEIAPMDTWNLRHYLTRINECCRRSDDPKVDTEPKFEEHPQIRSRNYFFLHDFKIVGDYAIFLFCFVNPNGADVAYRNRRNRRLRVAGRTPEEGVDHSAHFVVKLSGQNGLYPACLEEMPGLTVKVINDLLSAMNSQLYKYHREELVMPDPAGIMKKEQPVMRKFRTQLSFGALPSDTFWEKLQDRNALCSLMLQKEESKIFDTDAPLTVEKCDLYLRKPDASFFSEPKKNIIALCVAAKKQFYDKLILRVKDDDQNPRTIAIDVGTLAESSQTYVKSQTINAIKCLSTGYSGIDDEVSSKMKTILT